jgi:hypothetical protein
MQPPQLPPLEPPQAPPAAPGLPSPQGMQPPQLPPLEPPLTPPAAPGLPSPQGMQPPQLPPLEPPQTPPLAAREAEGLPPWVQEVVEVPSNDPAPVTTRTSLRAGQAYMIEASGEFSVWDPNNPIGVDAVYCYHAISCATPQLWNQLLVDELSLSDLAGRPMAYNPQHVYRVRYTGKGKPLVLRLRDAAGSWRDNGGKITVVIVLAQ